VVLVVTGLSNTAQCELLTLVSVIVAVTSSGIVAISVGVILILFTVGVLPVVVAVCCCGAQKGKSYRASSDESGQVQADAEPVYAQVEKKTDDVEVKLKMNVSYVPFVNNIEMEENIAYGFTGHKH